MREKCSKCIYSCPVNVGEDCEMLKACLYILMRYEKRPCPAGEECTVFEERHKP